ncbi:hypothetical protein MP228_010033 [Amoeboaphelidium protococcarum]|nr:hypothetical protein MP228_010033 [Amoeboaphelidium protococcarum]
MVCATTPSPQSETRVIRLSHQTTSSSGPVRIARRIETIHNPPASGLSSAVVGESRNADNNTTTGGSSSSRIMSRINNGDISWLTGRSFGNRNQNRQASLDDYGIRSNGRSQSNDFMRLSERQKRRLNGHVVHTLLHPQGSCKSQQSSLVLDMQFGAQQHPQTTSRQNPLVSLNEGEGEDHFDVEQEGDYYDDVQLGDDDDDDDEGDESDLVDGVNDGVGDTVDIPLLRTQQSFAARPGVIDNRSRSTGTSIPVNIIRDNSAQNGGQQQLSNESYITRFRRIRDLLDQSHANQFSDRNGVNLNQDSAVANSQRSGQYDILNMMEQDGLNPDGQTRDGQDRMTRLLRRISSIRNARQQQQSSSSIRQTPVNQQEETMLTRSYTVRGGSQSTGTSTSDRPQC